MLLIDDGLARHAAERPDREALVCDGRRLTYRQLNDLADRFATGLIARGLRRGDAVVIYLENSVEAVVAIHGALRAGGVFVPVGSTVKAEKLAYILNDSEATTLITEQRLASTVTAALPMVPGIRTVVMTGEAIPASDGRFVRFDDVATTPMSEARPLPRRIDLDLAALVYTSGSTGRAKGVMLTHVNMVAAATSIGEYLGNTPDDTILDVLPLSFDYGLYQVFLAFQAGARLILARAFVYPGVVLELLDREGVTGLPLVPTLVALLLKHDLSTFGKSLRYITNTGAVLPPPHIAALRRQLPHVRIFSMYGLTECKRVSFLPPEDIDERPTSVGRPMDNVEVFVADEHGNLSTVGTGELVIRGSNVMSGYWRASEATDRVLTPGVLPGQHLLRSGDRFRIDDDGYMYFIGRMDDMIKSRGQRVSPKEVENAIYGIPGVTGAAVVGIPHPVLGMAVTAYVTAERLASLTEMDVIRHCSQHLEDYMVPERVTIVDQLPKTESGKIDRRNLQMFYATTR